MKVKVVKYTFCYERYVVFSVFNEKGELIDNTFECPNEYTANSEFKAFAELNGWEFDKIENI